MDNAIVANMLWPPSNYIYSKMREYAAWYSGDPEILANYYSYYASTSSPESIVGMQNEAFWGRQLNQQGEVKIHVPIAGDIAAFSSDTLFSEPPIISIKEYDKKDLNSRYKEDQSKLDEMLNESDLLSRLIEASETCAAIGGVYIKLAWDTSLSEYPIPIVVQADMAIPTFKFGKLVSVIFWKKLRSRTEEESKSNVVFRMLEEYTAGSIETTLWKGNEERLGVRVDLSEHPDTAGIEEFVSTRSKKLLAAYVPNKLPNRLDRNSYLGGSDYAGIEGLMDTLDEIYTNWTKEIGLALAKVMVPESFLEGSERKYNKDKTVFVTLNVDPVSADGKLITPQQFEIRAEEFEKTAINYLERIITSAGYSPQSFGLNIQGRAESGTALNIREGKTSYTKNKKEKYWQKAIRHIVECMVDLCNYELNGVKFENSFSITVEFPDTAARTMQEISNSVKMISDATAASISTKVRMLHPDWSEADIVAEVEAIKEENSIGVPIPELDIDEMQVE